MQIFSNICEFCACNYMLSDFKKKNSFRLLSRLFVIERYLIELNKVFDPYYDCLIFNRNDLSHTVPGKQWKKNMPRLGVLNVFD